MMYFNHRRTFVRCTKPLIGLAVLFSTPYAFSQTNMFWNHYSLYNPAMNGVLNRRDIALTGTYQALGDKSASSYYANYSARVDALHGGVGISYSGSAYNGSSYGQLTASYSYHIKTGTNSLLALGVSAGLIHATLVNTSWVGTVPSSSRSSDIALNTGAGISYRYKNLTTGISVQHLNEPVLGDDSFQLKLKRSYNFFIDYKWQLSKNFALQPSVMLNMGSGNVGYPASTIALRAIYKERYWAGVSSSRNRYGFMLGYTFKNDMSIGYSMTVQDFNHGVFGINHGLTLRFQLK